MTNKKILAIIAISFIVHFAFFGNPAETVFDEVHFGKFVSGYYTGEYYFDIHPPLGKLIIAGFAKLFDFKPQYSFVNIGDKFPDNKYLVLRFLPTLAGTLLPVVIYLLILELNMSPVAALAGGLLVAFDNALLTQSRLILLDPFLLLFGFTSLLFYFKSRHSPFTIRYSLLTAVFAGLAISIKWTALTFVALPILIEGYNKIFIEKKTFAFIKFVSFFTISLVIYFSVFVLHFILLPKPGPGDAFMRPNFREQNIAKNILNLNLEMYKSNQRLGATHPYGSHWYEWPFMTRPIYYWVDSTNSPQVSSRIYFLGNPIVWWASMIAVVLSIKYLLLNIRKKHLDKTLALLLGGYFLNLLPFIGVKRVMFLYHYLTALIFAMLMLVYLIEKQKSSKKIFGALLAASIVAFIFFAPLSYGLPLSPKLYELRVWFSSWK